MKTDPQTKCANCEARYSHVEQGRREFFIPWGSSFLCNMCHRIAILEALRTESKPPWCLSKDKKGAH